MGSFLLISTSISVEVLLIFQWSTMLKVERELEYKMRAKFDQIDKNGDGHLSVSELEPLLSMFGEGDETKVKQIISKWDTAGDGKLSFREFMSMVENASGVEEDEALKKAFAVFNKNGDGFITWQELKDGLSLLDRVSNADVDNMMQEADTNMDGKIDIAEFIAVMKRQ